MKSFTLLITILVLTFSTTAFGQNCDVEIRTLEGIDAPEGYKFMGEAILMKAAATSLEGLSEKQIQKIKKDVGKYGSCVVYVDFNKLYDVTQGLYYVWTNEPDR